jgi:hypothetical protein
LLTFLSFSKYRDAIETTGVTMGIVGEIEVAVGLLLEAVFTPRTARDTAAVMVVSW